MSKKEKSRLLNYIIESGKVVESYRDLSLNLGIPLSTLHRLIKKLLDQKKIIVDTENHVTCFKPYGTVKKRDSVSKESVFSKIIGTVKKSLFIKELSSIDWKIIEVLETHAISKKNAKFSEFIIEKVNEHFDYKAIKNSMVLRTKHLIRIKRSGVFTRRIFSHPEYGYWIPLKEEQYDITYTTKKNLSSMLTDVIDGTNISIYFDFLNNIKDKHMKIDGQGRLVFNTENPYIKVYGDDLLLKNGNHVALVPKDDA